MLLKQRTWIIVALQALLIVLSLTAAWLLRFEFSLPHKELLFGAAPLLVLIRFLVLRRYNLFHGYWRYTGVSDAADVAKAVGLGSVVFFVTMRFAIGIRAFPISVVLLEAMLTAISLAAVRMLARIFLHKRNQQNLGHRTRVLIVGAGAAAEALLRELKHSQYVAVGCVDDDKGKRGASIHGLTVLGTIEELSHVATAYRAEELFIAMPSVTGLQMGRVIEYCLTSGRKFKTIPSLGELLKGRATVEQLRDVNLEELLGRAPVLVDLEAVRRDLADRVVLVTGAAGSIGQELCAQILDCGPARLICLDQAETPMFFLEMKLAEHRYSDRAVYSVADITDQNRIKSVLLAHGVQVIFNAAAYKHVPLMERNVAEALRNNVFGLIKLLRAAEEAGCERFLSISSDKAVNPTSVMGATKRIGELILASHPLRMQCASVRFGNVLGSQGSAVPIFRQQISQEGRVTVTHPEITRYFMTIAEAVSLVLQAFTVGAHGDILVLDMGEPIRIVDLVRTLIRLTGASEKDVPIIFTGLRPGEKLFEERFYSSESLLATQHEKIQRTQGNLVSWPNLWHHLRELEQLIQSGSGQSIRAKIHDIVPEYNYETIADSSDVSEERLVGPVQTAVLSRAASANG